MITPLILTFNEQENLERTLRRLSWASDIVVVDSGSTDRTLQISAGFQNVRVLDRPFDNFANQCNYGIKQCNTNWILSLDADYCLSPGLESELRAWKPVDGVDAWFVRFLYCIYGRPIRRSLYPSRAVLFRRDHCRYIADGHAHRLQVLGETSRFINPIYHDDRKPLSRWLSEQSKYAQQEATKLQTVSHDNLGLRDRVRLLILPAAPLVLIYTLFAQGLFLSGWRGWFYSFQRAYAELLLSLILLDGMLRSRSNQNPTFD